jgi:hypothetical protein
MDVVLVFPCELHCIGKKIRRGDATVNLRCCSFIINGAYYKPEIKRRRVTNLMPMACISVHKNPVLYRSCALVKIYAADLEPKLEVASFRIRRFYVLRAVLSVQRRWRELVSARRRLALAMAFQARLGAFSGIQSLPSEIIDQLLCTPEEKEKKGDRKRKRSIQQPPAVGCVSSFAGFLVEIFVLDPLQFARRCYDEWRGDCRRNPRRWSMCASI